jgi:ABC-2 type transport system permease protein
LRANSSNVEVAYESSEAANLTQQVAPPYEAKTGFWLPMASLWWREMVRFARQRSRVFGMVVTPLLFWLFIGSGFGNSFHPPSEPSGGGYLQYFFPGTVVMVVLFTSVLAAMSVIEDRREGFLVSVLVAPIHRSSLILGKVLGGTTQSMIPGVLFLALAPFVGFRLHPAQFVQLCAALFLISFCLTCLGFFIAWRMDSAQGFHAVLNVVLIPMWLLSGALFPVSGASTWIQWIMRLNPLTYGVAALRRLLYTGTVVDAAPLAMSFEITTLFAIATFVAALIWTGRPTAKNLG